MSVATYHFCGFRLGVAERELSRHGKAVLMPARVFELLVYLLEHRDRAVGRDELVKAVFGRVNVSDGQLSQVVLRARRCLGDDGKDQRIIRTVPRFGFRWVAQVEIDAASPGATCEVPPPPAALASRAIPRGYGAVALVAVALVVVLGVGSARILGWGGVKPDAGPAHDAALPDVAVLVLPATVEGGNEEAWARLGLMDLVAKRLRGAGLAVPESENTLAMVAGLTPDAAPSRLRANGASDHTFVHITALSDSRGWRVDIHLAGGSIGRLDASGSDDQLLSAAHTAIDELLLKLDRPVPHVPLEVSLEERLQRATAAMYSNQLARAREILTEARELHESHPLLRYQLAQIDFREGAFDEGARKLQDLLADGALPEGSLLHVQVLNSLGAMHVRRGRYAEAETVFDQAEMASESSEMPGETGRALMGRGLSRALQGDPDSGLLDLGRARVQMARAGDAIAVARVDSNLGTVELVRNRPSQAVRHFEKAREVYAEHDVINEWMVASTELTGALMALLEPKAAAEVNDEAWELRHRISDPGQLHRVTLDRVEIFLRAGRLTEAMALMKLAPTQGVSEMARLREQVVAVELLTALGEPRQAMALADRFMGERQSDLRPYVELQAWLRWRRQAAALQAGEMPGLLPVAPAAEGDPRARVADTLARALEHDLQGDGKAADALYLLAVRLADEGGSPRELVEAVAAWVPRLIARGELEQARAVAGRIAAWGDVDFDAARVSWLLYGAMGEAVLQSQSEGQLRRLAGQRLIVDAAL